MKKIFSQVTRGSNAILDDQRLMLILRIFLGSIFVAASLLKLPHQAEFIGVVSSYNMLPGSLAR